MQKLRKPHDLNINDVTSFFLHINGFYKNNTLWTVYLYCLPVYTVSLFLLFVMLKRLYFLIISLSFNSTASLLISAVLLLNRICPNLLIVRHLIANIHPSLTYRQVSFI